MFYLLLFLACVMAVASDLKLELVQVLFRHGARTNSKYEEGPMPEYIDQALLDTYGYDQLTNIGKAQVYNLGRELRDRYNDFLGPLYKPDDLYACSTDTDRTKMSLQLVLAGLYPPAPEQTWNINLKWQPIPTHHLPAQADVLLNAFGMHKYKSLLIAAKKSTQYREAEKTLKALGEFLQSKGLDFVHRQGLHGNVGVYSVLAVNKVSKGRLPDWYTDDLYEELENNTALYYDLVSSGPEISKWLIGPLVKRFLLNMNVKEEIANPRKIYLYSGHDKNIVGYTRAHGNKELRFPDFASAVILEKLRDSQNRLYVRMLARTGDNGAFFTLKLGNYEEYCPIDEYMKIVESVIPSEEEIDSMYDDVKQDLKSLRLTDSAFKS